MKMHNSLENNILALELLQNYDSSLYSVLIVDHTVLYLRAMQQASAIFRKLIR